uniref:Eukaryotic translation initiation factor 4C n=1 Tax=Timema shepardi TaxID=629360 RepID=A0A7R9AL57_TIMSH|nr:unnamed protein product [Timema shepardi]
MGKGGKNRRRGKNENETEKRELVFKEDGQEYAQVTKMLGNGRLEAMCFDGVKRLCHIRGKLRKKATRENFYGLEQKGLPILLGKVWINQGDIILIGLRDYQDAKADVILKYTPDEARNLKTYGEFPETVRINETVTFVEDGFDEDIEFGDEISTIKTLLNHLQKHPGKYKEFLDENNKKDLPAPAPRKDRTVQQNIQTMLSREKMVSSHPYAQTTTNKITNMLVKGLLPYSFVEEEGFVELVKHFAPNYKIPARTTFSRNYLAVDDSKSECPGVKKLLQKAKNIVGHYRRSSQARERLHSLQERMQVPQLELIQYVETRWSSEYCMLQRLVEMKGPIAAELAQSEHNIEPLTNADWAQAKGVLEVLEPLAQATKEISGDSYPTSSMVIPILHCLSSHLNSRIQRQEEANLSTALRNELYRDFEEMDSTADEPEPSTSNSGLWSFFDSLPNERKEMNISEEVEKYLSEPRNRGRVEITLNTYPLLTAVHSTTYPLHTAVNSTTSPFSTQLHTTPLLPTPHSCAQYHFSPLHSCAQHHFSLLHTAAHNTTSPFSTRLCTAPLLPSTQLCTAPLLPSPHSCAQHHFSPLHTAVHSTTSPFYKQLCTPPLLPSIHSCAQHHFSTLYTAVHITTSPHSPQLCTSPLLPTPHSCAQHHFSPLHTAVHSTTSPFYTQLCTAPLLPSIHSCAQHHFSPLHSCTQHHFSPLHSCAQHHFSPLYTAVHSSRRVQLISVCIIVRLCLILKKTSEQLTEVPVYTQHSSVGRIPTFPQYTHLNKYFLVIGSNFPRDSILILPSARAWIVSLPFLDMTLAAAISTVPGKLISTTFHSPPPVGSTVTLSERGPWCFDWPELVLIFYRAQSVLYLKHFVCGGRPVREQTHFFRFNSTSNGVLQMRIFGDFVLELNATDAVHGPERSSAVTPTTLLLLPGRNGRNRPTEEREGILLDHHTTEEWFAIFTFLAGLLIVLLWRAFAFLCCRKEPEFSPNDPKQKEQKAARQNKQEFEGTFMTEAKDWAGELISGQTTTGRILGVVRGYVRRLFASPECPVLVCCLTTRPRRLIGPDRRGRYRTHFDRSAPLSLQR